MTRKILAASAIGAFAALGTMTTSAWAHTGTVTVDQTCTEWTASVALNHDTTPDRTVTVTSTIPGTTGIVNGHYNTSYGEIWSVSGPSDGTTSGTVTLKIDAGTNEEFSSSASLTPAEGCEPPPPVEVTVCRDGEIITIPESEVLPTDTETCPVVPPVEPPVDNPPVPETPELVPPVSEFNPPAAAVPTTPTAQVSTPTALPVTGSGETAAMVAAGLAAVIAGFALHRRGNHAQRGLLG